jgi:UDP-2-acetamido-2-deoxy-ribo-hexuluronate aminotransferase
MVSDIPGIQAPVVRNDRTCVWAQFTIQSDRRDALIASLKEVGVPTAVHYPIPLHKQPVYKDLCRVVGGVEASDRVATRVVSLPMHPYLDDETMQTIVHALKKAAALR